MKTIPRLPATFWTPRATRIASLLGLFGLIAALMYIQPAWFDRSPKAIINQTQAFGISGIVVETGRDYFVLESAALPSGTAVRPNETWRWRVSFDAGTRVERAEREASLSLLTELPIGARATVTSARDITEEFSRGEKRTRAALVNLY